ncbi:MAG: SH3 domain-containing protein [Lachnospiraceae bacterium]|nr:SH3 domain-containing protein [Lachnospiraceae bacterium]
MKNFTLLDKKSRTSIMYGVIICLLVAISFCIVKIATRPKVIEDNNFYLPEKEEIDLEVSAQNPQEEDRAVKIEIEDRARLIEDNVNIRSGPTTESERLGSAYKGFDYKILSKDNSEWIKIEYDGRPAYVFAEYVEIVPMFLNDMGEYEEYVELDENGNAKVKEPQDSSETDGEAEDGESTDTEETPAEGNTETQN